MRADTDDHEVRPAGRTGRLGDRFTASHFCYGIVEAMKDGGREAWRYRTVRVSISSLYVDYKGKGVWTLLRDDPKGPLGNADNTYKLLRDRLIDELPGLARRRHEGP